MDANLSKLLDEHVDKTFFFKDKNITIEKWKIVAGNYCVITDIGTLQFHPSELQLEFLDKLETERALEKKKENITIAVRVPDENKTVKETLLDMLHKVKSDPSFIPQAKAICDITNAMVNVQKTEIDMVKLQNRI